MALGLLGASKSICAPGTHTHSVLRLAYGLNFYKLWTLRFIIRKIYKELST